MNEKSKLSADGLEVVAWSASTRHPQTGKQSAVFEGQAAAEQWAEHWRQVCKLDASVTELCRLTDAQRILAQLTVDRDEYKRLAIENQGFLSQLREELAQRDAEIARLEADNRSKNGSMKAFGKQIAGLQKAVRNRERLVGLRDDEIANLQTRLTGMTFDRNCRIEERNEARKRLAASVGGEREAFERFVRRDWPAAPLHHVRDALPKNDPRYGEYVDEVIQRVWVGWQARAALSPAGGGVVMPEMNELSNVIRSIVGWSNMGAGRLAEAICDRLNAKPKANSQEGQP